MVSLARLYLVLEHNRGNGMKKIPRKTGSNKALKDAVATYRRRARKAGWLLSKIKNHNRLSLDAPPSWQLALQQDAEWAEEATEVLFPSSKQGVK